MYIRLLKHHRQIAIDNRARFFLSQTLSMYSFTVSLLFFLVPKASAAQNCFFLLSHQKNNFFLAFTASHFLTMFFCTSRKSLLYHQLWNEKRKRKSSRFINMDECEGITHHGFVAQVEQIIIYTRHFKYSRALLSCDSTLVCIKTHQF